MTYEFLAGLMISSISCPPGLDLPSTGYSWGRQARTRHCTWTRCSRTRGSLKCDLQAPLFLFVQTTSQIHGQKSFTIFPPRDLPYLLDSKGCAAAAAVHHFCFQTDVIKGSLLIKRCRFADFLSPDTSRFPSLSKAAAQRSLSSSCVNALIAVACRPRRSKCCCSPATFSLCRAFGPTGFFLLQRFTPLLYPREHFLSFVRGFPLNLSQCSSA
jgi:hypothetical protein